MSTISDRSLDDEERDEFLNYGRSGLKIVGASAVSPTQEVVALLDAYISNYQKKTRSSFAKILFKQEDNTHIALALGVAWGDQLVKEFGWEWVNLIDGQDERYAVVSPDRALAVYATYFVKYCMDHSDADCTALLAYNMLKAGNIPPEEPNSYFALMNSIHRIVPRA